MVSGGIPVIIPATGKTAMEVTTECSTGRSLRGSTAEEGMAVSSSVSRRAVARGVSSPSSRIPPGKQISPAWWARRGDLRRKRRLAPSSVGKKGTRTALFLSVPSAKRPQGGKGPGGEKTLLIFSAEEQGAGPVFIR